MRGIAKSNDGASATRLAYSPDGKFIATGASDRRRDLRMPTEEERIGDEYSDITVWNMETGKAIWETRAHSGRVTGLAFSPDCQILASAGKYGVRVWDVRTWRELEHFDNKDMFGVAFSSRGHLAWTTSNETVVWDPMERRIVLSVNRGGFDVAFNPAGTRVAFGNGNTVVLVDSESGEEFWKARARTRPYRLAFSPDGQKLAVGVGREGNMVADVFDANNGQELVRITSDFRSDLTLDLEFSPDSRLLATANIGAVRIWNATTGHQILRFSQNAGTVFHRS